LGAEKSRGERAYDNGKFQVLFKHVFWVLTDGAQQAMSKTLTIELNINEKQKLRSENTASNETREP
jgi:hypothetical protein